MTVSRTRTKSALEHVLVIDVGGTHIKVMSPVHPVPVIISSGPRYTPRDMVKAVREVTKDWSYEAVAIGYPGVVVNGRPAKEPVNLGPGWVRFDFAKTFAKPVRMINDAALQALGAYQGGRMLFLGFGTGLGSAMIADDVLLPMEIGHLPYRHGRSYEEYVGVAALERLGRNRWRHYVQHIITLFRTALEADEIVIGGGNAMLFDTPPEGTRRVPEGAALVGGQRLWQGTDRR